MTDLPVLLTVDETAERLRIGAGAVRRYIASGALEHQRIGRLVFVRETDVLAYMDRNYSATTSAPRTG